MEPIIGGVVGLVGLAIAGAGVLWTTLAVIGSEWDFCTGGTCIAGEVMGAALAVVGVVLGWSGIRVARQK
jgi:hypothetical protein